MKRTEIEPGLLEVFRVVLGHPVAASVTRAAEPGWDSLKHMALVFAVEEKYGVRFTDEDIPRMDSLRWFVDYLERHHAA